MNRDERSNKVIKQPLNAAISSKDRTALKITRDTIVSERV